MSHSVTLWSSLSAIELILLVLVIAVAILALWRLGLDGLHRVLHVHLQVLLRLLAIVVNDLNLPGYLERVQNLESLLVFTLVAQVTSHLELLLQVIAILEDADVQSLLLLDLLTIGTFLSLSHRDLHSWELLDSDLLLVELILVNSRLVGDLLLSPSSCSIDIHGRYLVALTGEHVLSESLLLVEASIHLARVVEVSVLAGVARMLNE